MPVPQQLQKFSVPQVDKFWQYGGETPLLKWKDWQIQLDMFFTLTDFGLPEDAKLSDSQKNMLLRSLLGAEGIRQFTAHPDADKFNTLPYSAYCAAAKSVFGRPINAIRAHYDFNMRKQGATETIQEYILALRSLMADCNFHGKSDYFLATQLATGCYSKDTQQRLLAQKIIDLDEFVRIAEAEESSTQNASSIRGEHSSTIAAAHFQPSKSHQDESDANSSNRCFGCGDVGHIAHNPKCPQALTKCSKCGLYGHSPKFCRKPKHKKMGSVRVRPVIAHGADNTSRFQCSMLIRSCSPGGPISLKADVDSCADLTGITRSLYEAHFAEFELKPIAFSVTNFDGSEISGLLGSFDTDVQFEDKSSKLSIYVLPDNYGPVFGKDAIHAFGLILDGRTFAVYSNSAPNPGHVLSKACPDVTSINVSGDNTMESYPLTAAFQMPPAQLPHGVEEGMVGEGMTPPKSPSQSKPACGMPYTSLISTEIVQKPP